jgi:hypothetical protein
MVSAVAVRPMARRQRVLKRPLETGLLHRFQAERALGESH